MVHVYAEHVIVEYVHVEQNFQCGLMRAGVYVLTCDKFIYGMVYVNGWL